MNDLLYTLVYYYIEKYWRHLTQALTALFIFTYYTGNVVAAIYYPENSSNNNYISNDTYHGNVKYQLSDVRLVNGEIIVDFNITNLWSNKESVLIFGKNNVLDNNRGFGVNYDRPYLYQLDGDKIIPEITYVPPNKRLYSSNPVLNGELVSYERDFGPYKYGGDNTIKVVLPPGKTVSGYVRFPAKISYNSPFYAIIPCVNGWGRTIVFRNLKINGTSQVTNNKKPVVVLIDGMCLKASLTLLNDFCWSNYLREAFLKDLQQATVGSFQWTGDIRKTPKLLEPATKIIRDYYKLANKRNTKYIVVAHSWGSVLAYQVFNNNQDILVDKLITLGSPLYSQNENIVRNYTHAITNGQPVRLKNIKKWHNYWAYNDIVSGPFYEADMNYQIDVTDKSLDIVSRIDASFNGANPYHSRYYSQYKNIIINDILQTIKNQNDELEISMKNTNGHDIVLIRDIYSRLKRDNAVEDQIMSVMIDNEGVRIILLCDKIFVNNTDKLNYNAENIISRIADTLKTSKFTTIRMSGYSDPTGEPILIQMQTDRRATIVKNTLISNKVDDRCIVSRAYGGSNPIASSMSAAGRALNNRIEININ